mgnify:CR=1 FL=1
MLNSRRTNAADTARMLDRTIAQLRAIIREYRPQILVAHGYSDHQLCLVAAETVGEGICDQLSEGRARHRRFYFG